MGTWFLADSARYRRQQGYDVASFLFFAWGLLLPLHLIATRKWRAWLPMACFVIVCVAAWIFPLLMDLLYSAFGS